MKIFNTLSRTVEPFVPLNSDSVGLYSCGPTVYHYVHLGNLRTYVMTDLLKRVLLLNGYKVNHIMNITDVGHLAAEDTDSGEDKIEKAARAENKTVADIANYYTQAFLQDVHNLNILPPSKLVKATAHINEQIAMIQKLVALDAAYETSDGVYFDITKAKNYGALAKLDEAGLKAGARIEVDSQKRNAADFALWKKLVGDNVNHSQRWMSPWGVGFPGWHIECSAMAVQYLGQPFDIHTGGSDLVPVHHTNEIAQAETANGKQFVKYWVHGAMLVLGTPEKSERMGKSLGNFTRLQNIIEAGIEPLAYRYLTYTTHYRQLLYFSTESLQAAATALSRLRALVADLPTGEGRLPDLEAKIKETLSNDLDAPKALAMVWEAARSGTYEPSALKNTLLWFGDLMGLDLDKQQIREVPDNIKQLAVERDIKRAAGDWAAADALRAQITAAGFTVRDLPEGKSEVV